MTVRLKYFDFIMFLQKNIYKKYRHSRHHCLQAKLHVSYIFVTLSFQDHLILNIEHSTALENFSLYAPVFPLVLTICWVTGMVMTGSGTEEGGQVECWDDYSDSSIIYIIVTPMILALTVTNIFGNFVTCNSYFVTGQSWNSD